MPQKHTTSLENDGKLVAVFALDFWDKENNDGVLKMAQIRNK